MHHIWGEPGTPDSREATVLWRYFPTDYLLQVLRNGRLYFAAASQFEDRFEGATRTVSTGLAGFPAGSQAAAFDAYFGNARHRYKVSCWHEAKTENALMWQAYASMGKGAAICTTLDRIVQAIRPYRIARGPLNDVLWCGRVKYLDLSTEQLPPNSAQPVGMVKRFFYKHNAFEPEREFRFLADLHFYTSAVGDPMPPDSGILIDVDLSSLVKEIVIGPNLSEQGAAEVTEAAISSGLSDRLKESTLRQTPRFV